MYYYQTAKEKVTEIVLHNSSLYWHVSTSQKKTKKDKNSYEVVQPEIYRASEKVKEIEYRTEHILHNTVVQ